MSDSPVLSTLTLPLDIQSDDVIGFRDQLGARIAALLSPAQGPQSVVLPAGVEHLDALPSHIDKPWKRFDAAVTELASFRATRAGALANDTFAAADEPEQEAANADADDRWRAFEQWNRGAAGLSDDGDAPSPTEARWLFAQLFPVPDGLRFITRRPRVQWSAMEQRMAVLQSDRAKDVLDGFGGGRHHAQLAAAHTRFGKAFGFTSAVIEPDGGPTDGRPQWLLARDTLRTLVQKVETYADPEIDGSEALTTFLLGPYIEMITDLERVRRAREKKAQQAPTAPAAPAEAAKTP